MKERPIIFNTEMVRAILEGRKTQTRRVANQDFRMQLAEKVGRYQGGTEFDFIFKDDSGMIRTCPYGKPGDLLWVRETWKPVLAGATTPGAHYKAELLKDIPNFGWRPSIHMPKVFARLWLRVKDIRVERVQDISFSDMLDEGIEDTFFGWEGMPESDAAELCEKAVKQRWINLWDKINKKRGFGWDVNPWVWVVKFEVVEAPNVTG